MNYRYVLFAILINPKNGFIYLIGHRTLRYGTREVLVTINYPGEKERQLFAVYTIAWQCPGQLYTDNLYGRTDVWCICHHLLNFGNCYFWRNNTSGIVLSPWSCGGRQNDLHYISLYGHHISTFISYFTTSRQNFRYF